MSDLDVKYEFEQWPQSRFPEPKVVEGGIRLQLPPEQAVRNWWALRWLEFIESHGIGYRWERAKQYALKGQVLSIDICSGLVKASVQGAQEEPYRVTISVTTIGADIWNHVIKELRSTSEFGVVLSSGALLPESVIDRAFTAQQVSLFPCGPGDVHTKCTCPDWSNPCKHVAAVALLLAAEFDGNPQLIFRWRGIDNHSLFKLLSPELEKKQENASINTPAALSPSHEETGKTSLPTHEPQTSSVDPLAFWNGSITAADVCFDFEPDSSAPSLPETLGYFPFWQSKYDFLSAIGVAYEHAAESASELLLAAGKQSRL